MNNSTLIFSSTYFDRAVEDLSGVIETAKAELADVDFDTFVATGLSGTIVTPALALAMGKHFLILRKENDDSHHGGGRPVGWLGRRWIFVDDFVSSGKTFERVCRVVDLIIREKAFATEHVGNYLYNNLGENDSPRFEPTRTGE